MSIFEGIGDFGGGDRLVLVVDAEGFADAEIGGEVLGLEGDEFGGGEGGAAAAEVDHLNPVRGLGDDFAAGAAGEDDPLAFFAGEEEFLRLEGAGVEGDERFERETDISAVELVVYEVGVDIDRADLPGDAVVHEAFALADGTEVQHKFRLFVDEGEGGFPVQMIPTMMMIKRPSMIQSPAT